MFIYNIYINIFFKFIKPKEEKKTVKKSRNKNIHQNRRRSILFIIYIYIYI